MYKDATLIQPPCLKALNDRVAEITEKAIADVKLSGAPLDPEFIAVQKPMSLLWAGAPVYAERFKFLVFVYAAIAVYCVVTSTQALGVISLLLCAVSMFVAYDIYSGVLHIVLDHPGFIALPILGQPCLEFQWHHSIPDDLVKKDFLFCLGDLNMVTGASLACHVVFSANMGQDKVVMMLIGLKVAMAYFGQFSHKSAHQSINNRGPIVRKLQDAGIMISVGDHHRHHTPPHDDYFCLVGVCNKALSKVHRAMPNPNIWLVVFLAWTVADINILAYILSTIV